MPLLVIDVALREKVDLAIRGRLNGNNDDALVWIRFPPLAAWPFNDDFLSPTIGTDVIPYTLNPPQSHVV